MADGPTVGGYPKIAVVIGADLSALAQLGPRQQVRFVAVPLAEAQAALGATRDRLRRAAEWIRDRSGE